jgi:hypothetical protein
METEETEDTKQTGENAPQAEGDSVQTVVSLRKYIIRMCGGYSKGELKEACKISYNQGGNTNGVDMIDVASWHYNKFGRGY